MLHIFFLLYVYYMGYELPAQVLIAHFLSSRFGVEKWPPKFYCFAWGMLLSQSLYRLLQPNSQRLLGQWSVTRIENVQKSISLGWPWRKLMLFFISFWSYCCKLGNSVDAFDSKVIVDIMGKLIWFSLTLSLIVMGRTCDCDLWRVQVGSLFGFG